jgi:hypothetical protein
MDMRADNRDARDRYVEGGIYKDYHSDFVVSEYMPTYIATRALKP